MIHALTTLSPLAVFTVSVVGFFIGFLWYAPLFGKAWMKEMKFTPEMLQAGRAHFPLVMGSTLLLTILSTVTLAILENAHHSSGLAKGAELGLFVSVGLIASRQATNAMYERRTLRHFLIVAGHDVALCTVQGALLGLWR